MEKMDALLEAHKLIHGERAETYGSASHFFHRLARLFSEYLGYKVSAKDVVVFMIFLKLERLRNSDYKHRDSLVDMAGYVGLLDEIIGE